MEERIKVVGNLRGRSEGDVRREAWGGVGTRKRSRESDVLVQEKEQADGVVGSGHPLHMEPPAGASAGTIPGRRDGNADASAACGGREGC